MVLRDEFKPATKELLAKRVGYRCSNPYCRQQTVGPQEGPTGTVNVGVAAHITGAASSGPRYDPSLSFAERTSIKNGIWLCQNCAKLIDSDKSRYTVEVLNKWKVSAESASRRALEEIGSHFSETNAAIEKAERLMPDLLAEMRTDLSNNPLSREFVLLKKNWSYWSKGYELVYYYDDHPDLDSKLQVLSNLGMVREITYNNTKRFLISEALAGYLLR